MNSKTAVKSKVALISVYNKEGIVDFAKQLVLLDFKILASGGTAKALVEAGLEVTDVATMVGGPILGHRVVTLSREIHAGLLSRDNDEDNQELEKLKIPRIDLVCVDLYPLQQEIDRVNSNHPVTLRVTPLLEKEGNTAARDAVIEKTDIGGPTMIRSAAKGRRVVVCDPADRQKVIDWLKSGEPEKEKFISWLVAKAEYVVADYCLASARFHSDGKFDGFLGQQIMECKYGENGFQTPAGLYSVGSLPIYRPQEMADKSANYTDFLSLGEFKLIAGTPPSYNNLADVDRLLQTITHIAAGFETNFSKVPKIAVGVKHGNPCGAAASEDPKESIQKMLEGDLRAIFGGVVMLNFAVDESLAEVLLTHKMESGRRLLDGVIAPSFTQGAVDLMKRKGDKCRFLVNNYLSELGKNSLDNRQRFRYIRGGFLKQPNYNFVLNLSVVRPFMGSNSDLAADKSAHYSSKELSDKQKSDLILAWAIGSTSNSNTVTIVKNKMLIGNGVGQQDRVSCCQLAIKRATDAGHDAKGAAAYSDSFFPFVDGVEVLANAGIASIFATSGSVRDEEVKKFCAEKKISLLMLPDSQARGFFGH